MIDDLSRDPEVGLVDENVPIPDVAGLSRIDEGIRR